VSCVTCMDQLLEYQFDKIFPDCRRLGEDWELDFVSCIQQGGMERVLL